MPALLGTLRTGTSGIVVPGPKTTFPEAYQTTSRLTYYATLFNSVEMNSTFYRIPQPKTVAAWAAETGPGFDFTLKLWRDITHTNALAEDLSGLVRFLEAARELGPKKGCLLLQFPPSNTIRQLPAVSALLTALATADPAREWRKAVEFRHASWYAEETFELLDHHGASLVLHDKGPARNARLNEGAAFVYLRFHGPQGNYRASFCTTRPSRYTTTCKRGKTCMPTSTIPWAPRLKMPKTCTGW
jgi:uncharacterized protein YecE (DUF72 family)